MFIKYNYYPHYNDLFYLSNYKIITKYEDLLSNKKPIQDLWNLLELSNK